MAKAEVFSLTVECESIPRKSVVLVEFCVRDSTGKQRFSVTGRSRDSHAARVGFRVRVELVATTKC